MKTVRLRNVELGDGDSKIIVPITGATEEEIIAQAKELNQGICDLAEWRVDLFEKHHDVSEIVEVAKKLRNALGDMPFIFTIRTKEDGGKFEEQTKNMLKRSAGFFWKGNAMRAILNFQKESRWFKVCLRLQKVTALRRSSAVTVLTRLRLSTR